MLLRLTYALRLTLTATLLVVNTLFHSTPVLALAMIKVVVAVPEFRRQCSRVLIAIARSWVANNGRLLDYLTPTRWTIEGLQGLRVDGRYLVWCNHQSWVDIPVLQYALHRRVPFLTFFLKQQLIWVPVLGLVWWALDFPFMRRYTRAQLERNPQLRGRDLQATRKACERFKLIPVSITNFVEGTRRTEPKHQAQDSPYRYLLRPRAGGIAFVMGAIGGALDSILDVSIVYPDGPPTLPQLLGGRVRAIQVRVRELAIPSTLLDGDYETDADYRARFQQWINQMWQQKDQQLASMQEPPR